MPLPTIEEQREYQRLWMRKRRQDWIDANGPCSCGSSIDLQVDHIDPRTKSMQPASIWGRNEDARNLELAKCQVLCYECHKDKTSAERKTEVQHGTYSMRYRYGCTCELCRQYVRDQKSASRLRLQNNNGT